MVDVGEGSKPGDDKLSFLSNLRGDMAMGISDFLQSRSSAARREASIVAFIPTSWPLNFSSGINLILFLIPAAV